MAPKISPPNITGKSSGGSSSKNLKSFGALCPYLLGIIYLLTIYVSVIVATKIVLYISSWVTSSLNEMLCVHASKTLFSL